jgi:uncharacterized cupredoxin-like copper-binding protein
MLGKGRAAAGLLLAAAALAGCGGTVIDTSKIEAQAQSELEKTLPSRLDEGKPGEKLQQELGISPKEKIDSVDCPSDVEVTPGDTFECTVNFANGNQATETFRIENEDADVTATSLRRSAAK